MNPTNISIAKKNYSELLSLTQLFLLREYKLTSTCPLEMDTFESIKPLVCANSAQVEKKVVKNQIPAASFAQKTASIPPPPKETATPQQIAQSSAPIAQSSTPSKEPEKTSKSSEKTQKKKFIGLEPIVSRSDYQVDASYVQFFNEHFPQYRISKTIPCDQKAKRIKDAWKIKQEIMPVIIVCFHEQKQDLAFLTNIARAINLFFSPACILSGTALEKNQQWEEVLSTPNLRLVIASDYEFYLQPSLMKHYSQDKISLRHFLGNIPLLLLSDLSLYLKKPELKQLLWNAIKTEFAQ